MVLPASPSGASLIRLTGCSRVGSASAFYAFGEHGGPGEYEDLQQRVSRAY